MGSRIGVASLVSAASLPSLASAAPVDHMRSLPACVSRDRQRVPHICLPTAALVAASCRVELASFRSLERTHVVARVSLTIDDAPSPSTPAILDILREHSIKATQRGSTTPYRTRGPHAGQSPHRGSCSILDELHVFEQKLQECDRAISEFQPVTTEEPPTEPLETQQLLLEEKEPNVNEAAKEETARPRNKWMRPASGWFTTPMREITERHGYRSVWEVSTHTTHRSDPRR
ncbi:Glycoside hydrolase/deacetylase, beta/alpha-barrel [Phytophthora cactorum]|nr:Glycoside hydrolase/deacetylase, beta/alpha-barrel [Phytophthora cactorum]